MVTDQVSVIIIAILMTDKQLKERGNLFCVQRLACLVNAWWCLMLWTEQRLNSSEPTARTLDALSRPLAHFDSSSFSRLQKEQQSDYCLQLCITSALEDMSDKHMHQFAGEGAGQEEIHRLISWSGEKADRAAGRGDKCNLGVWLPVQVVCCIRRGWR